MYLFDQQSAKLALILADKPFIEPLLTAIFGAFLIAVAVGLNRLNAFLAPENKHGAGKNNQVGAQSMTATRLGDLPAFKMEKLTAVHLKPTHTESTSSNVLS
jgi:hypothetical protein